MGRKKTRAALELIRRDVGQDPAVREPRPLDGENQRDRVEGVGRVRAPVGLDHLLGVAMNGPPATAASHHSSSEPFPAEAANSTVAVGADGRVTVSMSTLPADSTRGRMSISTRCRPAVCRNRSCRAGPPVVVATRPSILAVSTSQPSGAA